MSKAEEDEWIVKGARWAAKAADEIRDAGGSAHGVIGLLSDQVIQTMVRNKLGINYTGILR